MKKKILRISNLYCNACESRITKILCNIPQVIGYRINIFTKELYIEYERIKLSEIKTKISSGGFFIEKMRRSSIKLFWIILAFYILQHLCYNSYLYLNSIFICILINILYYKQYKSSFIYYVSAISILAGFLYAYVFDESESGLFFDNSSSLLVFKSAGYALTEKISEFSIFYLYQHNMTKSQGQEYKVGNEYKICGKICFDGTVKSGEAYVNESNLTGESKPIFKKRGDKVYCGSEVVSGEITVKAEVIGKETKIGKILKYISKVEIPKDRGLKMIEKSIIYFSIVVFTIWMIIGLINVNYCHYFEKVYHNVDLDYSSESSYFDDSKLLNFFIILKTAMFMSLNTLVIACPCVLSIAEPLLFYKISQILYVRGILVKNLSFINKNFSKVYYDKTGTLTSSRIKIKEFKMYEHNDRIFDWVYELEKDSLHPVGAVLREYSEKRISLNPVNISCVEYKTGGGISAVIENELFKIGSESFVTGSYLTKEKSQKEQKGKFYRITESDTIKDYTSDIYISLNNKIIGEIKIESPIKPSVFELVEIVHKMKLRQIILTGDSLKNTLPIAQSLSIPVFYHSMSANDKMSIVDKESIFIGDGINDSPALSKAGLGISVNIENENANLTLIENRFEKLVFFFNLLDRAKRRSLIIKTIAVLYNVFALPAACGLLIPFGILFDLRTSCLCMLLNSLAVALFSLSFK